MHSLKPGKRQGKNGQIRVEFKIDEMEGERCADGSISMAMAWKKEVIQESIAQRKILLREKAPHFILKHNYIRVYDETV